MNVNVNLGFVLLVLIALLSACQSLERDTADSASQTSVVADCNNTGGDYTEDASVLDITWIRPLADCPPGSLTQPFITYLDNAVRYAIEDGNLVIDLLADSGTMVLSPSDNISMVAEEQRDLAEISGRCTALLPNYFFSHGARDAQQTKPPQ